MFDRAGRLIGQNIILNRNGMEQRCYLFELSEDGMMIILPEQENEKHPVFDKNMETKISAMECELYSMDCHADQQKQSAGRLDMPFEKRRRRRHRQPSRWIY